MSFFIRYAALAAIGLLAVVPAALAGTYNVSLLDGGHWNTVYAQGFSTSVGAIPDPSVPAGSPVTLSKFEFFKSGNADAASDIQLAILNNIFVDMSGGLTASNSAFVGLSTNTIASTAGIATGDPIAFDFADLQLEYGGNYAAVFVNVGVDEGSGVPLTPVLVSALDANYVDVGGGVFQPQSNYGEIDNFLLATSNFISNGFFNTFSFAGDANFRATLNAVPEPAAASMALAAIALAGLTRKHNRK